LSTAGRPYFVSTGLLRDTRDRDVRSEIIAK
jgi:hypothetical protein